MRCIAVVSMTCAACLMVGGLASLAQTPAAPAVAPEPAWIARSNQYAKMLLDVSWKHYPEGGSSAGLAQFDPLITSPTRADEIVLRKEFEDILARLKRVEAKEKDKDVRVER